MSHKKIRTIFLGTPDFAVASLEALISAEEFEVIAIITQPDKKIGRHQELLPPPIKKIASKHNIEIYQPEKIRTEVEKIKHLQPDLIVVTAYGQIIPPAILEIPKFACVNVHGSLLPQYRGAACLQAPILNGNRYSGVTIMKMDAGLDTGPILKKAKIKLAKEESVETLHDKLSELGAKILIPTLIKYCAGKIKPQAQSNYRASYVKMLKKEDGKIDWHLPAKKIERMVRALNPWPGTYSLLSCPDLKINSVLFKILSVRPKAIKNKQHASGEIFNYNGALAVKCGNGQALIISKLQLEGRKAMDVDEFLRGNKGIYGSILK
ncbi:MAG: methionyl-tRNA formyltransferase [Candidatus Falkowbacteria bacterium]